LVLLSPEVPDVSDTSHPYGADLAQIADLLGGDALRESQTAMIVDALDEDREGVHALAENIAGRKAQLNNPMAVFLTRVRGGDHLERVRSIPVSRSTADAQPAGEVLRRLYYAKLDDLTRLGWRTHREREREAIDYAVSYLPSLKHGPMPDGILELEAELRRELNIDPLTATTAGERAQMLREWRRIAYSLHDREFAAMHRALMQACKVPGEPTNDEARDARAAMIAELDARNIEPRPFQLREFGA
jgi:hypothetical protein